MDKTGNATLNTTQEKLERIAEHYRSLGQGAKVYPGHVAVFPKNQPHEPPKK